MKKAGDIISIAYVGACLNQRPDSPDTWVQVTWDMFTVR